MYIYKYINIDINICLFAEEIAKAFDMGSSNAKTDD